MGRGDRCGLPILRTTIRGAWLPLALAVAACGEGVPPLPPDPLPPLPPEEEANEAPGVAIAAPADGFVAITDTEIEFEGTATDPEQGALSGESLVWSSDRDGELGTGERVVRDDLTPGDHTVMLEATDAEGATGDARVSITVELPPEGIVFASDRDSEHGIADIYVMDGDGGNPRNVSDGLDGFPNGSLMAPAWSPDGSRIALSANMPNVTRSLFTMRPDGSDVVEVLSGRCADRPAWSPDGSRIAYARDCPAVPPVAIGVVNADGTNAIDIVDDLEFPDNPAWHPDGELIAFEARTCQLCDSEIFVVAPDGSGLTGLLTSGVEGVELRAPAWSPDGNRVALEVCAETASGLECDIWFFDFDTSESMPVTSEPGFEHSPAWSPGGDRILFVYDHDIHVIGLDGTGLTNLTNHAANDEGPHWFERPGEEVGAVVAGGPRVRGWMEILGAAGSRAATFRLFASGSNPKP